MPITLNGDNGITNVNGTAAAPAITGTDTDSGMYFGTNSVALSTAGTAALTIDASGSVNFPNANQKITLNGTLQFQTSQTDNSTNLEILPTGTHRYSAFRIYNTSDIANSGIFQINGNVAGTLFRISSFSSGTGTVVPIDVQVGSTVQSRFQTNGDFQFNSGYGSVATAYGCRAWVNFNGTGTVAIRASGNVSSITDNGTGNYTVNFTTAMPDSNYTMAGTAAYSTSTTTNGRIVNTAARGTTSCGVTTSFASNTNEDEEFVQVAFFR